MKLGDLFLSFYLMTLCSVGHFSIIHINALRITERYIQSNRLLLTSINCSLYTIKVASLSGGLQPIWPLVLRSLQLPRAFYQAVYLELIAALRTGAKNHNNHVGAIHALLFTSTTHMLPFPQSNHISVIKSMLSIIATYLSLCSLMYLCVPCYCHVCLSLLRCVWDGSRNRYVPVRQ